MAGKHAMNIFLAISLLLNSLFSIGQSMQFKNIGVNQGLSHSYAISFLEDSQGLIWIGTFDGLNLFTGQSFLNYNSNNQDTNSISNNCIYSIIEDSKGIIWVGTEFGLNKFDKKTGLFKSYYHDPINPKSLSHNHIRGIYEDKNSNIWVITYGGGFGKFNKNSETFTNFQVNADSSGLLSNKINTLHQDSRGLFWLGTENGGISIFDPKTEKFVDQIFNTGENNTLNDNTVNTIYEDKKGVFWIGTWFGGLNKFTPQQNKWEYFTFDENDANSIPSNTIRDIEYDRANYLWIATFGGGICRFNMSTNKIQTQQINKGLSENILQKNLWSLYKDGKNNLWIGSFGDGVYVHNHLKSTFPYYYIKSEKNNSDELMGITSVLEDHNGILWLGTKEGALYNFNLENNTITEFTALNYISQNTINAVFEDRENQLWLGTNFGLYSINKERTKSTFYPPSDTENGMDKTSIISVYEDKKGDLWLGMWGIGINVIKHSELKKANPKDTEVIKFVHDPKDSTSISHHIVWGFMEDSHGNMWISTSGVLNRFDRTSNRFTRFDHIKTANSVLEDDAGYLWASSLSDGLYKFDNNGKLIDELTGEIGSNKFMVESLLQDNTGTFWMSSRNKLYRYNPITKNLNLYTSEYGLQNDNFNINACTKLKSGELVFAGMKGINIFRPENIPTEKNMPEIIITDFKIFNQSIAQESGRKNSLPKLKTPIYSIDSVSLEHQQNIFSIEFTGLDYINPDELRFLYKLEGFNKDWIETDYRNKVATYTNLNGGEYTFKVKSTDILGGWNSKVKELKITISQPFWQKKWFKTILLACLSVILLFLVKIRINKLRQDFKRNQEHVKLENLQRDYDIVSKQIEDLKTELDRKNKKNASLALKQLAYNERITLVISKIKELKNEIKSTQTQHKLNLLLTSFEEEIKINGSDDAFKESINLLYDNFIERFAKKHLKLTHKDLKVCAYIRMNKTNREIAETLHITKNSLEISRYRIRKKLTLPVGTNLNDYILRF